MRDRSGIAAVEFAITGPVFVLLACVLVNLSYAYFIKLRVANATTAAALYALSNGQSVTTSTAGTFLNSVRTVAQDTLGLSQTATIGVTFNNATDGSNAGNNYCVSGYPATWISTGSTTTGCPTGTTSGKYVTIAVSVDPGPLLFGYGSLAWGGNIGDYAMVRVK